MPKLLIVANYEVGGMSLGDVVGIFPDTYAFGVQERYPKFYVAKTTIPLQELAKLTHPETAEMAPLPSPAEFPELVMPSRTQVITPRKYGATWALCARLEQAQSFHVTLTNNELAAGFIHKGGGVPPFQKKE